MKIISNTTIITLILSLTLARSDLEEYYEITRFRNLAELFTLLHSAGMYTT